MTFQSYIEGGTVGTFTLSGVINSTNTLFTLPIAPNELQVYLNGLLQIDAALGLAVYNFSWSVAALGTASATITFSGGTSVPQTGDTLVAWVWTIVP